MNRLIWCPISPPEIAEIKGLSVEDVALAASRNTRRLFSLPPREA